MRAIARFWKVLLALILVGAAVFIYFDSYTTEKMNHELQVLQMQTLNATMEGKIQNDLKYADIQDKLEPAKAELAASRLELYQKFPKEMREEDQIMYVLYLESLFKEEIFFTFSEAVELLPMNDGAVLEGLLISVNYETTYQGFQEMIDYLAKDSRIASVYEATIEYDEKKDTASGYITLLLYLMDSDQLEYTPPEMNIPETGKDNIFE